MDEPNPYLHIKTSPDGSLRVELVAVERSNTHWVYSPRVSEVATGRVILDLWNTNWDAEVTFPRERCVSLDMRRYRYRFRLRAELDLGRDSFAVFEGIAASPSVGALAEIGPALEAASARAAAIELRDSRPAPPRVGWCQWRLALLILLGGLAAIAAITFVVVQLSPVKPDRKLTPLQQMPNAPSQTAR